MKIFGREPALWLSLIYSIIAMIGAFVIDLSVEQQGVLQAVFAALFGVITAFMVRDGQSASILGFVKALLAVALAFGLHLSPENQAIILTAAAAVVGMFVRTQVTAPVPADPPVVP